MILEVLGWKPGEIIVMFRKGLPEADCLAIISGWGHEVLSRKRRNSFLVGVPAGQEQEQAGRYAAHPDVAAAEPNYRHKLSGG